MTAASVVHVSAENRSENHAVVLHPPTNPFRVLEIPIPSSRAEGREFASCATVSPE
jgi:hypothetical protein